MGERGAAAVLVALWLPALVAGLLLVAEAGRLLALRQSLTDAAEAAALAAVRCLDPAARGSGELRIDPAAAAAAAREVAAANLQRLGPAGADSAVTLVIRQSEPAPAIGPSSHGGRSVAGQERPPSAGVTLHLAVRLLGLPQAVTLSATAWVGLRPEQADSPATDADPLGMAPSIG